MAAGSEQISARWLEGVERVCRDCGAPIRSLARDVGSVDRDATGAGSVRCMTCHLAGARSRWREAVSTLVSRPAA